MNQTEKKYSEESSEEEELEFLEESIIFAWENNQQEFVVAIEDFLDDFLKDKDRNEELIGNVNKFQRKVIHQLCDRFNVLRTYVDVKSNDNANITIQKTESSEIPEYTVKELYERHLKRARRQQQKTLQQNGGGQTQGSQQQQQQMMQQMMNGQQQQQMMQQMMNGQQMDPMMMQQMMMMQQQMMMGQPNMQPRVESLSQLNKQNQNMVRNQQQQNQLKSQTQIKKQVNLNHIIDQDDEFPALS